MYLEFYGLSEKPFSQTPDPRFLYWNDHNRETLASLSYGIRERKGFIAMLGEAGTGKTTLLRKLLDDLGDDIVSVFLFNPNATFEEILEYTLSELGITTPSGRKLAMLQRLNEFLLAAYGEGRNTILLIDEAQDLDSDVLESLRLLSNLETSDDKILQIVLSGQPELAEKLADPSLRQLKQRIAVRCRLDPLQRDELPDFLSARLAVAGGSPDLFDPETHEAIWAFSSGIPRIINTVCDNALLLGYALGKRTIDGSVMQEVIADLRKLDVEEWAPTRPPQAARSEPAAPPPPAIAPPAPPPETPYYQEPAPGPRPELQSAGPPRSGSSVGWLVAFVLGCLVVILAGAWLTETRRPPPESAPAAPAQALPAPRSDAMGLSGTAVATAATGNPTRSAPAAPVVPSAPADRRTVPGPRAPAAEPSIPVVDAPTGNPGQGQAVREEPVAPVGAAPVVANPEPVDAREPAPAKVPAVAEPAVAESTAPPMPAEPERPTVGASTALTAEERLALTRTVPVPTEERAPPPAAEQTQEAVEVAAVAEEPPAPARHDTVSVNPGDTLTELAGRHYGRTNLTTLDMLRAVNPGIRDVDLIIAGSGLEFPEPGPASRILSDGSGYSVLALTTQTLSRALAVQSSLEDELGRPVSLERVATRGGPSVFRVSVRGLSDRRAASDIANGLGPILEDPSP